jgi:hypothetical protein
LLSEAVQFAERVGAHQHGGHLSLQSVVLGRAITYA